MVWVWRARRMNFLIQLGNSWPMVGSPQLISAAVTVGPCQAPTGSDSLNFSKTSLSRWSASNPLSGSHERGSMESRSSFLIRLSVARWNSVEASSVANVLKIGSAPLLRMLAWNAATPFALVFVCGFPMMISFFIVGLAPLIAVQNGDWQGFIFAAAFMLHFAAARCIPFEQDALRHRGNKRVLARKNRRVRISHFPPSQIFGHKVTKWINTTACYAFP